MAHFSVLLAFLLPHILAESTLKINLDDVQWVMSDKFLSITIDAGTVRGGQWSSINFTSPKILNLAKALSPAMLRVGGTSQDSLVFQKNQQEYKEKEYIPMDSFIMTTKDWDAMNQFVQLAGWEFIFGLNVLLRTNGSWNSSNARDLFQYTLSKGYSVSWELGNEPDLFYEKYNETVEPQQLAKDFQSLKEVLSAIKLQPEYIAGPDVATLTRHNFFHSVLSVITPGVLKAVTWHQYYLDGAKAVLPDMYDVDVLDKLVEGATLASNYTSTLLPGTELWLGETSSCYGGGAPKLSDSFVSGFMWLDKLGVAALTNHSRVFRQDFIGGSYSLLDVSFNPLPDYWLSVLYKKLVGERVLSVSGGLELGRHIRAYAHCARQPAYKAGDVVLYILNAYTYNTTALLTNPLANTPRDVYWLSPPGNTTNVLSKEVTLNGKILSLVNNTTLPDLSPLQQEPTETINLPALSFGFYVFKDVKAEACIS